MTLVASPPQMEALPSSPSILPFPSSHHSPPYVHLLETNTHLCVETNILLLETNIHLLETNTHLCMKTNIHHLLESNKDICVETNTKVTDLTSIYLTFLQLYMYR